MANPQVIHSTTQKFLDIYDVANDLLLMKEGAVSLVLTVSAINFGLLAEEEQDAVIYSYAGLLNSLNYPIEIVIRSQTKDVTNYLNLLVAQEESAVSETKKKQIGAYRAFVSNLVHERNVLDKKFYVVIPASALEMGLLPPSTVIPGVKSIDISTVERSVIMEKARNILEPKRDHLVNQFSRIGLYARQLTSQEIIQLFYLSYNPEAAEGQQITDTSNYTSVVVSAQVQADWKQAPQAAPEPTYAPDMAYQPETQPIAEAAPAYETQPVPVEQVITEAPAAELYPTPAVDAPQAETLPPIPTIE
jgi:hypothetical protein